MKTTSKTWFTSQHTGLVYVETLTAAKTVSAAETGTKFILNLAGGIAVTLPAPAEGLNYEFVVGALEPTSSHTILTYGSANIIEGQVGSAEDAAGSVATAADSDTITLVANKAIHGDYVKIFSDGTNWYVSGLCNVQDAITTTQAT